MLKLVKITPYPKGHTYKYCASFKHGTRSIHTNFGRQPYEDYTIHKNKKRRNAYIRRHLKDLRTNDPTRAGYLSMFILWNKTSLTSSIRDYKKRLETYNNSQDHIFPIEITGF